MSISHESFDLLAVDRNIEKRDRAKRLTRAALWGGLLAIGLRKRGVLGLAAVAISLERLYRLLAPQARESFRMLSRSSARHSPAKTELDREWDRIDEALWETFPASDPPGHIGP